MSIPSYEEFTPVGSSILVKPLDDLHTAFQVVAMSAYAKVQNIDDPLIKVGDVVVISLDGGLVGPYPSGPFFIKADRILATHSQK